MKAHHPFFVRLLLTAVLTGSCFIFFSAETLYAQTPSTPASDPVLVQQLSQLQARVVQLEAALAKVAPPVVAPTASTSIPGTPGAPPPPSPVMNAGSASRGGANNMMAMMDKMMGMMNKMTVTSGSPPMASGGSMTGTPPAAGVRNMSGGMTQSPVAALRGASHLYHIGATGFFLDHPQLIALTTEQQVGLRKAKDDALLAKSTADRAIEQAEQALWMLTAPDQPDATQVEAKVREIEKLRGDQRLAFIRAVGDASKLLTEEQRKSLTDFAPPTPANSMTAPGPGMPAGKIKKDM